MAAHSSGRASCIQRTAPATPRVALVRPNRATNLGASLASALGVLGCVAGAARAVLNHGARQGSGATVHAKCARDAPLSKASVFYDAIIVFASWASSEIPHHGRKVMILCEASQASSSCSHHGAPRRLGLGLRNLGPGRRSGDGHFYMQVLL